MGLFGKIKGFTTQVKIDFGLLAFFIKLRSVYPAFHPFSPSMLSITEDQGGVNSFPKTYYVHLVCDDNKVRNVCAKGFLRFSSS